MTKNLVDSYILASHLFKGFPNSELLLYLFVNNSGLWKEYLRKAL